MSNFDRETFQKTLKKIIGGDTNAAFASKAGISRVYLQNLLSAKAKAPSKEVAMRISRQSVNKAYALALINACGYSDSLSEKDKRALMDEKEWAEANVCDVKRFFDEYPCNHPFDKKEFVETFHKYYADTRAFINFGEVAEYKGEEKTAENVMFVRFTWHNMKLKIQQILTTVLYGHYSQNLDFYITDKSLAVRDIADAFPESRSWYQNINDAYPEDGDIFEAPHCYICKHYDPMKYIKDNPASPEERLLKAIFGGEKEKDTISFYGYGFYLDDQPEHFLEFLANHRGAFEEESREEEFCRKVLDEGEAPESLYKLNDQHIAGAATIIADIMTAETGLDFIGFVHENEDPRNRNCVMIDHEVEEDEVEKKVEMKKIVEKYARELHLPRIETVVFYEPVDMGFWYMRPMELKYAE